MLTHLLPSPSICVFVPDRWLTNGHASFVLEANDRCILYTKPSSWRTYAPLLRRWRFGLFSFQKRWFGGSTCAYGNEDTIYKYMDCNISNLVRKLRVLLKCSLLVWTQKVALGEKVYVIFDLFILWNQEGSRKFGWHKTTISNLWKDWWLLQISSGCKILVIKCHFSKYFKSVTGPGQKPNCRNHFQFKDMHNGVCLIFWCLKILKIWLMSNCFDMKPKLRPAGLH